jgi:hypothetical protein
MYLQKCDDLGVARSSYARYLAIEPEGDSVCACLSAHVISLHISNSSLTYVTYVRHYEQGNPEDNEGDRARSFRRS